MCISRFPSANGGMKFDCAINFVQNVFVCLNWVFIKQIIEDHTWSKGTALGASQNKKGKTLSYSRDMLLCLVNWFNLHIIIILYYISSFASNWFFQIFFLLILIRYSNYLYSTKELEKIT